MPVHAATPHRDRRAPARAAATRALVRTGDAARRALEACRRDIAARTDAIAEAELAAETLRLALQDFAGRYEAAVAEERRALTRVRTLLAHLARWVCLLEEEADDACAHTRRRAALGRAREATLQAWRRERDADVEDGVAGELGAPTEAGDAAAGARTAEASSAAEATHAEAPSWHARRSTAQGRLKQAFRALARRYHPDMVQDEAERARRGQWMVHVNALYAAGDVARLEVLVRRTQASDPPEPVSAEGADVAEALAEAEQRLAWLDAVLASLQAEQAALEASPTHALWHALEGGPRGLGLHPRLLAELRQDLTDEARARTRELPAAMRAMEEAVQERNTRQQAGRGQAPARRAAPGAVAKAAFDPHVGQQLMRLSLEDLAARRVPAHIAQWATRLQQRAEREPGLVRLMLLTYVVQLAPGNMPGLERYDELARRFDACGRRDRRRATLAEALVAGDGLVAYAPEAVGDGRLQAQLRFRDAAMMQVVPQALRSFAVRRIFAELLGHLGERIQCPAADCGRTGYAVPLFVVRGLDEVRASVCPRCGEAVRRYVLAKGSDLQGVLNAAYLEFDLVQEWTLALGPASVGLQLLPLQADALDVRALLGRLHHQLLQRNGVDVHPVYLELHQDGRRLAADTPLASLPAQGLRVVLRPQAGMDEAELVAALRFAVQTRFAGPSAGH